MRRRRLSGVYGEMIDFKKQGKRNLAKGRRFELAVRRELEKQYLKSLDCR